MSIDRESLLHVMPTTLVDSSAELLKVNAAFSERAYRSEIDSDVITITLQRVKVGRVAHWFEFWLQHKRTMGISESTEERHRYAFKKWERCFVGNEDLEATEQTFAAFLRHLRNTTTASDLSYQIDMHKAMWRWLVETGRIAPQQNITRNVPSMQRPAPMPRKPVLWNDWQAIIEASKKTRLYYLFVVCYETGLRLGGACMLRWRDVNLQDRLIRCVDVKARIRNKASITAYDPGTELDDLLNLMWQTRSGNPEFVAPHWAKLYIEKPLNVRAMLKQWFVKHGYRGVSIHSFRRAKLTNMHAGGATLHQLAMTSGHSDPSSLKSYIAVDIEQMREAYRAGRKYAQRNQALIPT